MKLSDAREILEECKMKGGFLEEQEMAELLLWFYNKGWSEGIEYYKEEVNPGPQPIAPDLKEIILKALFLQRCELLNNFNNSNFENKDDCRDYIETVIFSEDDLVDKALSSLNLTVEDIDPNDFRDFQHETVELYVVQFYEPKIKL